MRPHVNNTPLYRLPWNLAEPIDFLPDGRQNMCDGCPDMTVLNDELAWSCRLEELKAYGTMLRTVPRS